MNHEFQQMKIQRLGELYAKRASLLGQIERLDHLNFSITFKEEGETNWSWATEPGAYFPSITECETAAREIVRTTLESRLADVENSIEELAADPVPMAPLRVPLSGRAAQAILTAKEKEELPA